MMGTAVWVFCGETLALPVKVIILQLISHGPLIIILKVHHHSQHLGH